MNLPTKAYMAVPTEGIFDVGNNIAGDMKQLLLTLAGTFVAWLVLKFVFSAKSFTSAIVAIVMGLLLFWGLNNIENPSLKKPLDDTIQEYGLGGHDRPGT